MLPNVLQGMLNTGADAKPNCMLISNAKRMRFRPSLFAVCLTVATVACLLSLGRWQLHRAAEKQDMLQHHRQGLMQPAHQLPLSDNQGLTVEQYQRVQAQGKFINQHNFLLDNQFYRHRVGYDVITPLQLADGAWVLVDRGWVPMGLSRQNRPKIAEVAGQVSLEGHAYYPSEKTWVLSSVLDNPGQWPLLIEKINTDRLGKLLHHPLYPYIMRLDARSPHGFARDWKIVSMSPAKHHAYALQWFSMAIVVMIIFVGWNVRTANDRET